jgi:NO-binding membrane sensor protein with MHYT domain
VAFGHDPFLVVLSVLIAVQASYVSSIITDPLTTKRDLSPSVISVVR